MTYEEAIKYAKSTSFCCGCEVDMRFEGNEKVCDTCKHRLFFELAIESFKKQIPKKPGKSNRVHELGFCPNCNEPIKSRTCFKSTVGKIYISWCSECGQAIDWREVEE